MLNWPLLTLKLNDYKVFYLLAIAFVTDYLQYLFDPLHYISYICEFLICIVMLPHLIKLSRHTLIFYIVLYYFIFLIVRGILYGNFYKYIIFDVHIYTSLIFLTYFNSSSSYKQSYSQLPKLFAKLLILSIPIVFLLFILFGSLNVNDIYGRGLLENANSNFNEKMFLAPIIIAPLIVPFISEMKRSLKFTVLLSNALFLIYGVLTATRSVIAISILSYLSIINFRIIFKRNTIFSILLISTFIFMLSKTSINSFIQSKIEYSIDRFEMNENYTNSRNTEVVGLFKEFSPVELLIGRGSGAEQKFGFWKYMEIPGEHGINFTHFGFLHLILKGGFILLIIVYGLALYSLIILYRNGERKYFFVILIYLTAEVSHTQFLNYFYVIFLWVSISYALRLNSIKKRDKIERDFQIPL